MTRTTTLTLFAPGKMAGAEKVVSVGYNALKQIDQDNEHHLAIIQEESAPEYARDFASVIEDQNIQLLESESPLDLRLILNLRKIIKSLKIQIIHSHGYKALFYASLVRLSLGGNIKLVHTHHGNTGHTKKVIFYEKLAFLLMRYCHQVVSLSPLMERQLRGSKINKLKEVPNMYSLPPGAEDISPPTERVSSFLYLGRLSPEKNPLTLLESFKKLSTKYPQLELHMVGDGPLAEQLKQNYSCESIHFYGHIASPSKVKQFFDKSDYLCLPSLSEGMPMTVIEALCLGRPIIANKVGAIEYMVDASNSFLIDIDEKGHHLRNNPDSMTQKWCEVMEMAIENPKGRSAWENRENQRQRYSSEAWVARTKIIYQQL